MAKTVVGLMDNRREAEGVIGELMRGCGCDRADIGLMAKGTQDDWSRDAEHGSGERGGQVASGAMKGAGTGAAVGGILGLVAGVASLSIPGFGPFIAAGPIASALAGAGIGAAAGGLIGGLMKLGVPEDEAHYYAEGVRRGGTLITVHAKNDQIASCAADVMRRHGAADIDERAAGWKREGWSGRLSSSDEQVIPVAKEELQVGKRSVSKAGVRVYSHVVETPVEESVRLREEHAHVERRPVDRPISAGDGAFKERSVEVRETAEEPVVSKSSRVTEEVHVGKHATQREQKVRDSVRKTEVEVQGARDGTPLTGSTSRSYSGPERRKSSSATNFSGRDRRTATH